MTDNLDFGWEDTKEPKKKSRRKVGIILVSFFLIIILAVGGVAFWGLSKLNSIERFAIPDDAMSSIEGFDRPTHDPSQGTPPTNVLILGSDSRTSDGDLSQWQAGAQRTDVMMVMQISPERQSVYAMSIPRDSWVQIPGHGMAKINAAFSYGGLPLTIATVESVTGIPIDHVAYVDFTSFVELTDRVGGVEIMTNAGTQKFTGDEALAFVRERYSLPNGDLDRVRRQQAWMLAVMSKILTRETLTSPTKVMDLFDSISPYIALDDELTSTKIVALAADMKDVRARDVNLLTVPVAGLGRSEDGQSIVELDEQGLEELSQAFVDDNLHNYLALNPDIQTIRDGNVR